MVPYGEEENQNFANAKDGDDDEIEEDVTKVNKVEENDERTMINKEEAE